MLIVAKSALDPRWVSRHGVTRIAKAPDAFAKMSTLERREIERLARLTSQFTTQIRRAFLDAVDKLKDQLDAQQIAELLKTGHAQSAIDYVNAQLAARSFAPIAAAVTKATLDAGVAAAKVADVPSNLLLVFSHASPATVARLQRNEFRLIRELTDASRQQVASVIRQGITDGDNPLDVARDVREHIGLTERQSQAVRNYRDMLENGDSGALDRALRDQRFDPTVERAASGETELSQEQIDKMVARYEARYLKYRAETIARTEATRATNEGNTETWRQAVSDGTIEVQQITRQWIYTDDDRTRDAHIAIPEMNPDGVGLDEAFDTPLGPLMYPGDPLGDPENTINCRCATIIRYKPLRSTIVNPSISSV